MSFEIFTDSAASLPENIIKEFNIYVISFPYYINGKEFESQTDGVFDAAEFYGRLRTREDISTSLINSDKFISAFEPALSEGRDILYIGLSGSLSGTFQSAQLAADTLKEKYPERKIIAADSVSASLGEGLLVYSSAMLRKEGKTIEYVNEWIIENRLKMNHIFTVDDLFFLKRGGRLSGAAATIGTLMNIKPVLKLNDEGHIVPVGKAVGRRKALNQMVDILLDKGVNLESQTIGIVHADCASDAEYLKKKISEKCGAVSFLINYLDPIIGTHGGPDTIALLFFGSGR